MKTVSIKHGSEINIPGVEVVTLDGKVAGVIVRQNGEELHITEARYGGIGVAKRQEIETAERFHVTGTLGPLKISEFFEHEHEGDALADKIQRGGGYAEMKKVTVGINAAGEIVSK